MKLFCKKLISMLIVFSIFATISNLDFTVNATNFSETDLYKIVSLNKKDSLNGISKVIYDGLAKHKESVDVSSFSLTADQFDYIYSSILLECPELFFIDKTYSLTMNKITNKVVSVKPLYSYDINDTVEKLNDYNYRIELILHHIDNNWCDLQKVLYVHDYIINNFNYDTTLATHDAYNFLVNGYGVCESYTKLFTAICRRIGIETITVSNSSDRMSEHHAWNLVKVNKEWYHIDLTWDDPISSGNRVFHTNFLLSDGEIEETEHYDWVSNYFYELPDCNSTSFDNAFIRNIESAIVPAENRWYFINNLKNNYTFSYLTFADSTFSNIYSVKEIDYYWPVVGSSLHYVNDFTCIISIKGEIYLSTPDKVLKFLPETNSFETIYEYFGDEKSIFGLKYNEVNHIFSANLMSSPSSKSEIAASIDLSKISIEKLSFYADECVYTGSAVTPLKVVLKYNNYTLRESIDYKISYSNNINAGKGKAKVICLNGFVGEKYFDFKITAKNLSKFNITVNDIFYSGQKTVSIPITVKDGKTTLIQGRDYIYKFNNGSNALNFGSNTITVIGINNYCGTAYSKIDFLPSAIKNFKVISQSSSYIKLGWSKNNYCSGYYLYRATSKNGDYKKIATLPISETSYTDKNKKAGTNYYYKIRAIIKTKTNVVKGTTTFICTTTKPAKTTATVKAVGKKKVKISFSKVAGATKYQIYYSSKKLGPYKLLKTTSSRSYTKSKLKKGKRYYFKVRAYKSFGGEKYYGAFSSIKSVIVK